MAVFALATCGTAERALLSRVSPALAHGRAVRAVCPRLFPAQVVTDADVAAGHGMVLALHKLHRGWLPFYQPILRPDKW